MSCIIKAHNISKRYQIRHKSNSNDTLVGTLASKAKQFFSKEKQHQSEDFWALKDVDLEIFEGDRVGIIGRNGAGKSTLLKIISRITEPSSGWIKINGRVSSLLEVGTGFHPELTGRENIFLNGAILGMHHSEIKSAFDEIVAFADVEKFLDTPVKRYSSGMYTRLGFAIAAHLSPDLLIVDEVLAVGDSQFQEKCVKKMNELSCNGRTVIFVSHDLGAIINLCNKGIFLDKGSVREFGAIDSCINAYKRSCRHQTVSWNGDEGDESIRFYKASLKSEEVQREFFYRHEKVLLELEYEILRPTPDIVFGINVLNQRGQQLGRTYNIDDMDTFINSSSLGKHKAVIPLDCKLFHPGEYQIQIDCFIHNVKRVLGHEILLKLPIFSNEQVTRYQGLVEGISLGSKWSFDCQCYLD